MQITLDKIVRLTGEDRPSELRCAAITVLGELGGRDASVASAVIEALRSNDATLRLRAVRAAGQLRVEKALPLLIERIAHGGAEGELAAESAASLGAKGLQALQECMHKLVPGVRKYVSAALASSQDAAGLAMLQENDAAVVEAAVQAIAAKIPTLDAKGKKSLADELLEVAKSKKKKLSAPGEAAVVRLAGLIDDERVGPLLWDRILPPTLLEVRAAALQGLAKFATAPSKDQRARLFRCAADPLFRVAAPALMLLDKLPVSDKTIAEWLPLFDAPDMAARRFVLNKVGDRDLPEVADKLLEQLEHHDRKYREEVLAKIAALPRGRKALAKPLKEADSPESAWALARTIAPFAKGDPETWGDELFPTLCKHLETNDKRVDALIFLLREAGAIELRDRLEAKAMAARKKEDFEKSLVYYKAAARDPASGASIRLGLATVGLKLSAKDLEAESRAHDSCLHAFADMIRADEPTTYKEVESTKWLGPDELYYLGFHFVDHAGVMGEFGVKMLKLLVKRHPKVKLAAAAKNKLKSSGHA